MKISIDLSEVNILAEKADKIFIKQDAEEGLSKLLMLQQKIEEAITKAKSILEAEALKINPNFKSIEGDKIKVSYRYFGQKYYIEQDRLNEIPEDFYTKQITTKYSVNSDVVEKWAENNKGLPLGIAENKRLKTISIKLKNESKQV